jgi:hypothetical protein
MKGRALLFGLNYATSPQGRLQGCVNDVVNIGKYIQTCMAIPVKVCTDDVPNPDTTAARIVQNVYELALQSHNDDLDFVWIHYSGHGSYIADRSGDELDGRDECLVPSDYATAGLIDDDTLNRLLKQFNPRTRVLFVCDACHSGTMCDVKYSWISPSKRTTENNKCSVQAKVITLSGCLDAQTSADAFNVLGDGKFSGALTSCLLQVLIQAPALRKDVFKMHAALCLKLKGRGFPQRPLLCSTYDLARDRVLFL